MQRPQPEQRFSFCRMIVGKSEESEIRLFPDLNRLATGFFEGVIAGARGDHRDGRLLACASATATEFVG